jgi:hypothetical protein
MSIDLDAMGFTPYEVLAHIWAALAPFMPIFTVLVAVPLGLWVVRLVLGLVRAGDLGDTTGLPGSLRGGLAGRDLYSGVLGDARAWDRRRRERPLLSAYEQHLRDTDGFGGRSHQPMSWGQVFFGGRRRRRRGARVD